MTRHGLNLKGFIRQFQINTTLVLDSAISQCNADGGGRITIPKGIYFCKGPIHLKSNVHLYFEEGASITFSENPNHYLPQVLVRWEGTECYNYSPFIYANGEKNIAITGKGFSMVMPIMKWQHGGENKSLLKNDYVVWGGKEFQ